MTMTPLSMLLVAATVAAVGVVGARGARLVPPARAPGPAPGRRWRPHRRPRPDPPDESTVADWCDDAARAVRAGAALVVALGEATDAHPAMTPIIAPVLAAAGRGRPLAEAVDAAADDARDPASATGLALTVVRSCAQLGGPAAAPLERVAATLRTRAAVAGELRAHSAQAELSARVLTTVPVALLAILAATEPNVREAVRTPAGAAAVGAGAALNVAGWRWMRRIIGSSR